MLIMNVYLSILKGVLIRDGILSIHICVFVCLFDHTGPPLCPKFHCIWWELSHDSWFLLFFSSTRPCPFSLVGFTFFFQSLSLMSLAESFLSWSLAEIPGSVGCYQNLGNFWWFCLVFFCPPPPPLCFRESNSEYTTYFYIFPQVANTLYYILV